jgi:septum formation protein
MFGSKSRIKLILASKSPRRAEILRNAGISFEVQAAHVNEARRPRESAHSYVRRLATAKSRAVAEPLKRRKQHAIVIGADTVVLAQGKILGKPADVKEARRMLRLLSGKSHQVLTGVSIVSLPSGAEVHHVETTRVKFLKISNADIDDYISTGEPFDKAGAYGIQGIGGRFVASIDGCCFNVMGLPLARVWSMLRDAGYANTSPGRVWSALSTLSRNA